MQKSFSLSISLLCRINFCSNCNIIQMNIYGFVNISCNVSDNAGIATMVVNITYPNGTMYNHTLNSQRYYNSTYALPGNYTYFIWASDINGNSNTSTNYQFQTVGFTEKQITLSKNKKLIILEEFYQVGGVLEDVLIVIILYLGGVLDIDQLNMYLKRFCS